MLCFLKVDKPTQNRHLTPFPLPVYKFTFLILLSCQWQCCYSCYFFLSFTSVSFKFRTNSFGTMLEQCVNRPWWNLWLTGKNECIHPCLMFLSLLIGPGADKYRLWLQRMNISGTLSHWRQNPTGRTLRSSHLYFGTFSERSSTFSNHGGSIAVCSQRFKQDMTTGSFKNSVVL